VLLNALSFVTTESELRVLHYRLQSLNIFHHFLLISASNVVLIETELIFSASTVVKHSRCFSVSVSQVQLSILCHYRVDFMSPFTGFLADISRGPSGVKIVQPCVDF